MTKIVKRTRKQALLHWIKALESGKYKQAEGTLRETKRTGSDQRLSHSFCCIGVACDLARKDGGPTWKDDNGNGIRKGNVHDLEYNYFMDHCGDFPPAMRKFLGITKEEQTKLIDMNDEQKKSFKEIAKYIRTEILPNALVRD